MNVEQKYEPTQLPNAVAAVRAADGMTAYEAFQRERLASTGALIVVALDWNEDTGAIEVVYGFRTDFLLGEAPRRIAESLVQKYVDDTAFPPVDGTVLFDWDSIETVEEERLMRPDDEDFVWWTVERVEDAVREPIPPSELEYLRAVGRPGGGQRR